MTVQQINGLKNGDLLCDREGRYVEVEDTSRLGQFSDIEVWELETNKVGDLVRTDWDVFLLTVRELKNYTKVET